jgi:RNA polymerase sigma-70 factor (ECF subfamily)
VQRYRLLGSFDDSEDQVQETFLRAWRNRASVEGRATSRTRLYRIATNACLDALDRRPCRVLPPRQGAALILRDVFAWSANDSAVLLDVSVAGLNRALQRARATLRRPLPIASRLWWRISGRQANPSTTRSSSTCCGLKMARLPRLRASRSTCLQHSGCR